MASNFFNLSLGDKCYGLSDQRHDFLLYVNPKETIHEFTIDYINDHLIEINIELYNLKKIPKYKFLYEKHKNKLEEKIISKLGENYSSMLSFNNFCILNLELDKKYEYAKESELTYFKGLDYIDNSNKLDPYIKTRCKGGIIWTIKENKKIFFVLDNFDFKQVFNKTGCDLSESESDSDSDVDLRPLKKLKQVTDTPKTKFGNSYSSSELRFLYRIFESNILTKSQKKLIVFIKKNNRNTYSKVKAPWISDPSILYSYKPSNITRSWRFINE